MAAMSRSQRFLELVPALLLTIATTFAAGWLMAHGAEQELQPSLGLWIFAILCGLSAVAWSVPTAVTAWEHRPRKALSVFWRESLRAVVLRLVGGSCLGLGTLRVLWSVVVLQSMPSFWAGAFFFVSIGFGSRWWRLSEEVLSGAPRAARATWRDMQSFFRQRAAGSPQKHKKHQ